MIDVTEEVQATLAGRRAARAADAQAAETHDRKRLANAAAITPLHHLQAKGADGPALVVSFSREGSSGERRQTLDDAAGLVGAPAGEVRTPLQLLAAAGKIDAGQAAAGELFATHFVAANFPLCRGMDYGQVRGTDMVAKKAPSTAAEEARHWIFAAMEALGGGASPMAMAVWSALAFGGGGGGRPAPGAGCACCLSRRTHGRVPAPPRDEGPVGRDGGTVLPGRQSPVQGGGEL